MRSAVEFRWTRLDSKGLDFFCTGVEPFWTRVEPVKLDPTFNLTHQLSSRASLGLKSTLESSLTTGSTGKKSTVDSESSRVRGNGNCYLKYCSSISVDFDLEYLVCKDDCISLQNTVCSICDQQPDKEECRFQR